MSSQKKALKKLAKKPHWTIHIESDGSANYRYWNGVLPHPVEQYAKVTKEESAVFAVAISQGLEPPKRLVRHDTSPDETQSERFHSHPCHTHGASHEKNQDQKNQEYNSCCKCLASRSIHQQ